jgi:hypothetical protein
MQRYVNPAIDIASGVTSSSAPAAVAAPPRYPWLEPRLAMFRTPLWQAKYRRYERAERLRLPAHRDLQVMYFAERPASGPEEQRMKQAVGTVSSLTVLALQNTVVRVLAGSVLVTSSKGSLLVLTEDTCLLARGRIQLRAVAGGAEEQRGGERCEAAAAAAAPTPPAALWAVRNIDQQAVVEPQQHGMQAENHKLIIKKIFNCTDSYFESIISSSISA